MSSADQGSQKGGRGGGGPPRKESILELAKLMDAKVRVKCLGGRELEGTLRGYDDLVNLVLDDCDEFLRGKGSVLSLCIVCQTREDIANSRFRTPDSLLYLKDPEDMERITDKTRKLGLVVVRGTQVSLVSPRDGMEEIANPFLAQDNED